jgi:hypothetical protein
LLKECTGDFESYKKPINKKFDWGKSLLQTRETLKMGPGIYLGQVEINQSSLRELPDGCDFGAWISQQ